MSAPQSAAGQRNARPRPHWSSGNGHLTSLQAGWRACEATPPPGRTTPTVAASPARSPASPAPSATTRRPVRSLVIPSSSAQQFHIIVLDQGVGEELVGRLFERGFGLFAVAPLDLDVEYLALPDAGDAGDAERFQRAFDRLALGVQNTRFQGHGHTGLHGAPLQDRVLVISILIDSPAIGHQVINSIDLP